MSEVVTCPHCFGEGRIDLDDFAPRAAEVLKIIKSLGSAHTGMIKEKMEGPSSVNSIKYHLRWLENRDFISRKRQDGYIYYQAIG